MQPNETIIKKRGKKTNSANQGEKKLFSPRRGVVWRKLCGAWIGDTFFHPIKAVELVPGMLELCMEFKKKKKNQHNW